MLVYWVFMVMLVASSSEGVIIPVDPPSRGTQLTRVIVAPTPTPSSPSIALPVAQQTPVVARTDEYDPYPQYVYTYSVHDSQTGDSKSQQESRQGDQVQGAYSLVEPDGTTRTVQYTADAQNGFNAVIYRQVQSHPVSQPQAVRLAPLPSSATPLAIQVIPQSQSVSSTAPEPLETPQPTEATISVSSPETVTSSPDTLVDSVTPTVLIPQPPTVPTPTEEPLRRLATFQSSSLQTVQPASRVAQFQSLAPFQSIPLRPEAQSVTYLQPAPLRSVESFQPLPIASSQLSSPQTITLIPQPTRAISPLTFILSQPQGQPAFAVLPQPIRIPQAQPYSILQNSYQQITPQTIRLVPQPSLGFAQILPSPVAISRPSQSQPPLRLPELTFAPLAPRLPPLPILQTLSASPPQDVTSPPVTSATTQSPVLRYSGTTLLPYRNTNYLQVQRH